MEQNRQKTNTNKREGIPMTEEEIKDWQQSFIDIEESIKELYSQESSS